MKKAIVKLPGMRAEVVDMEDHVVETRAIVGRPLAWASLTSDCCIIWGREQAGMQDNCRILGRGFRGPVVVIVDDPAIAEDVRKILFGIA